MSLTIPRSLTSPTNIGLRDATRSNNAPGHYFRPGAIDIAPFVGWQFRVVFHVTTDRARPLHSDFDDTRAFAVRRTCLSHSWPSPGLTARDNQGGCQDA